MKNKPKHILIIRLSAMGDVAMTVPVIEQFIKVYPDVKITVLTKPFFTSIFKHVEGVSVVSANIKGEHKGIFGLWKLYRNLKTLNIDAIADFHNVLRSKILRIFFGLSGIPSIFIDKGRAEKKALTRETNKALKPLKSSHQRYSDVLAELGFPLQLQPIERKTLNITKQAKTLIPQTSNLTNLNPKLLGIAPFAAHIGKQYPLDLMTKVIAQLSKNDNYNILLFGGPEDVETLKELEAYSDNITSVAGKLSFEDEISLISNLNIMISMDSGNGHLAAMFGVPVITIWGVTHPYAGFVPYSQPEKNQILPDLNKYLKIPTSIYGNKVPAGYEDVMRSIDVETIIDKVKKAL